MSKYPIPKAALEQHVIALGKTGAGKSSKMRLIVEALLDDGKPITIIDPKGDWWGIKSSADGKRAGFPVVIFGGEHADVPLNAHAGAHVAELVGTGNRPSLIDLGGWTVGDRTRFFIDFASSLFKNTRGSRYLVIDEVHNFAPQGKVLDVDAGKMLHWANRLASEARGKGITIIAASQRPQKVHKDFLTSCETLIGCRVIHKLDRDAIKDWIDGCADPDKGKEVMAQLAGMQRTEAWVWSPEANYGPVRLSFPMFKTYDSFKPREHATKLKGWAEVDLEEVSTKLAAVVEEAKANDPAELRRQIADLKRQVASKPAVQAAEKRVEIPVLPAGLAKELESTLARMTKLAKHQFGIEVRIEQHGKLMSGAWQTVNEVCDATIKALQSVTSGKPLARAPVVPIQSASKARPPAQSTITPGVKTDGALQTAERRFLVALAQQARALTRNQVAIFAGYSAKSRHVDNTLAALRSAGHVVGGRDAIQITDGGISALGSFDPLPTGKDLRDYWMRELDTAASKFLGVLCEAYPGTITRDELAERAVYSPQSRHVDNTLAQLRSRDLATGGREAIRASENLFD